MPLVKITRIKIENYRSISKHPAFDLSEFNIFVGNNDAGKSNILKALDLFFNYSTSMLSHDFERDFSFFANIPNKKAPQIQIDLTFEIPDSYKGHEKTLVWTKIWRKSGIHTNAIKLNGKKIDFQSKIPTLLRSIRYNYVPAIKGRQHFSQLLEDVHDMLADTVEDDIRGASGNFTTTISKHTKPILVSIEKQLNIKSSLELPANLRELFATLDFRTKVAGKFVSLLQRGDGIQVQHIPIILKFLADQANINITKGSVPICTIWGYEEPENNLEMLNATKLADQLLEHSKDIQILVTTHSPAFYSLPNRNDSDCGIKLFLVQKNEDNTSQVNAFEDKITILDKNMGILPAIIPTFSKLVTEYKEMEKKAASLHTDEPSLFVEGLIDKAIIERAIELFDEDLLEHINIYSQKSAGANWVYDMLMAWLYRGYSNKAVGLFDFDHQGSKKCAQFNKNINDGVFRKRSGKAYAIKLCKQGHIIQIFRKKIKIPVTIEEMFPLSCWEYAEKRAWTENRRNILKYNKYNNPNTAFNDYCKDKLSASKKLMLYVEKRIGMDHKSKFKNYVIKQDKDCFTNFEPLITELRNRLIGQ